MTFINIKNFLFLLSVLFFFNTYLIFFNGELNIVDLTFILNFVLSLFFLFISLKKSISTFIFFYIFNLIFFVIAPWYQYQNNTVIWANINFNDTDYLFNNIIILLLSVFSFLVYFLTPKINFNMLRIKAGNMSNYVALFACSICFFIVFYSYGFNPAKLFFRGLSEDDFQYSVQVSQYFRVVSVTAMLLPGFIFLRFLEKKSILLKILIFCFVLLCAFPTAVPRFIFSYVYFPIFIGLFIKARNSISTILVIFFSMFIIFPFLNQFRYFSSFNEILIIPDLSFLKEAHFDAYQNMMDVIRYDFITYGYQLLGVFLFFVPRAIWDDKPVGSGYQLAENNNYFFNNISMPFIAEGYVNFGFLGLFLFLFIICFIMKQIDINILSESNFVNKKYEVFLGVFLCAALFFMFRGDLMSSYSNLLAGIIAYYLAKKI